MLDPKHLRRDILKIANYLEKTRGFKLDIQKFQNLEATRKALQLHVQSLQNERKLRSKAIGIAKVQGEEVKELLGEVDKLNLKLKNSEKKLESIQSALQDLQLNIPNLPDVSVPLGVSEKDNVEIRRFGEKRDFSFKPKDHVELGENLGLIDFTLAAKISGARFVVLHRDIARLQRALIQFMLDLHTQEHGYQEVYVPYLVKEESMFGTGQLPKFRAEHFIVDTHFHLSLIPTAEVPITNFARDEILNESDLPKKYVSHTPCFRSEAGAYGKDTRGMMRQHQFEKVELVRFERPERSDTALEELTCDVEAVLQKLRLSYRVMLLCGGDLGFSSAKTYDLEVWLPGQKQFREVSSCSNFGNFQARRMRARFRDKKSNKIELIHTLNGSGLAIGRTLIAVMENYQDEKGRIHVPEPLQKYMDGLKIIA